LCRAIRVVSSGVSGYLRASQYISLPRGTLERYVKDISRSPEELVNVHLGRTVLTNKPENKHLEFCIIMDQSYYGLRIQDIKVTGFQLAIRNVLKHPFSREKSGVDRK